MYHTSLGRRRNVNPVVKEYKSPYCIFRNNPILNIDWKEDDTIVHNRKGELTTSVLVPNKITIETGDNNKNTSYLVVVDGEFVIMNRNEAGNYVTGMAAARMGVGSILNAVSGHAVELMQGRLRMDEQNEQKALNEGYKAYENKNN